MAKFKKTAKKTSGRARPVRSSSRPSSLSRSLSESAQQIWLAGVGAFSRAQAEGTKLFEALVKEGMTLEQTARKFAGGQADVVRDAVEIQGGPGARTCHRHLGPAGEGVRGARAARPDQAGRARPR